MASKQAVANAMVGLAANYNRDLAPELVGIWLKALADVTDESLDRAVQRIVAQSRFFPSVAEVREKAGANFKPKPDTEGIVAAIWSLASYHPQYGTTPPSVGLVREKLGETIAQAYGLVGANRMFGGNETGRDIARREFARDLEVASEQGYDVALPSVPVTKRLASGSVTLYDDVPKPTGFKRLSSAQSSDE